MKTQSGNELSWIYGVIPSMVSLAWESFEKHGLTKCWVTHLEWENALADAIRKTTKLVKSIHPSAMPDGDQKQNNAEGATWLGQKSN